MLLTPKIHRFFFLLGIAISLCSLPYSPYILSVGFFTFSINWLLDGNWHAKYQRFIKNKSLWVFSLVYFSIAFSFFYSDNLSRAITELKIWVPLLVAPLVISTSAPLSRNEFKYLILAFCTSIFISTVIGFIYYLRDYNYLGQDVRYLSPFILHIRFALMAIVGIFAIWYMVFISEFFKSKFVKAILIALSFWFIIYIFILQSLTGIVVLFILSLVVLLRWAYNLKEPVGRFAVFVGVVLILLISVSYLTHSIDKYFTRQDVDFQTLPKITVNNNTYFHDTLSNQYENGYPIWINVCHSELKQGWERLSTFPIEGYDKGGHKIDQTIIRYLTSKNLTKDSVGLSKLDSIDIRLIENSVSSVIYREHKAGIYPRLYQLCWEIDSYRTRGAITGSSIIQRYIYAKSAFRVIKANFFWGVGIGDARDKLFDQYDRNEKNLDHKNWKSSHNQYLDVLMASGFIGFIMFIFGLLFPFFYYRKYKYFLPFVFMILILLSMLSIETLERHSGASFVALFYSIFFFSYDFEKDEQHAQ